MLPTVRISPHVVGAIRLHALAQHNHAMLIARIASIGRYCWHGLEVRGSVDRGPS